ncbi:MAG: OmpH family outer membrane protein [Armatimonadota bacterium]|jgi:Skp family chaperone for outer membrane proteins
MLQNTTGITRALAACALAIICATTSFAQDATTELKIAVVSLTRVQTNYQRLRAQEQDLGRWLESRRSYHDRLTNYVFLPKKDFEKALDLVHRQQPLPDEDREQLEELRRISDKNEVRFSELRARTERTTEETTEFNALQDMYDASAETLQAVQQSIMSELGDRRQTALTDLMDTVERAIAETAEAGGYQVVLDAEMVFYGGEDITDAVLERLNGNGGQGGAEQGEQGGGEGGEETGEQNG